MSLVFRLTYQIQVYAHQQSHPLSTLVSFLQTLDQPVAECNPTFSQPYTMMHTPYDPYRYSDASKHIIPLT